MEIGTIALFLTCSKQFTRPINEIANLYGQILTATACAERVFEILDSDNEVDNGTTKIDMDNFKGNIEMTEDLSIATILKTLPCYWSLFTVFIFISGSLLTDTAVDHNVLASSWC